MQTTIRMIEKCEWNSGQASKTKSGALFKTWPSSLVQQRSVRPLRCKTQIFIDIIYQAHTAVATVSRTMNQTKILKTHTHTHTIKNKPTDHSDFKVFGITLPPQHDQLYSHSIERSQALVEDSIEWHRCDQLVPKSWKGYEGVKSSILSSDTASTFFTTNA
jgi:hypothetical protein